MKINRDTFYQEYRRTFGRIRKQLTVDSLNALLDRYEQENIRTKFAEKLAYILATVRHECGSSMTPIEENLNYSSQRLRVVWPKRFYKSWIANKYAYNPKALGDYVYGGRLGNAHNEGYKYRGRGFIQLTGKDNYKRFEKLLDLPLVSTPSLALNVREGADIAVQGMLKGLFTGKKLQSYVNGKKKLYYDARSVVNADKGRVGRKIAADAEKFEKILTKAVL